MININMIAERRARKIREMTILRVSTLTVIALSVIMVLWNAFAYFEQLTWNSKLTTINEQLEEQRPRYEEWVKLQEQIAERQPVITLLEQVQKSEGAWMIMLADLGRVIPPDIVITRMNTTDKEKRMYLSIEGQAKNIKTIGAFMMALSTRTSWAEKPDLLRTAAESNADHEQRVRFEILVPIRGLMGGNM